MVDPITTRIGGAGAAPRATAPVAPVNPAPPVAGTPVAAGSVANAGTLARTMAAAPPVDADRVAAVKKALEEGRFPITPATIADRLIALKLQWVSGDGDGDDQA